MEPQENTLTPMPDKFSDLAKAIVYAATKQDIEENQIEHLRENTGGDISSLINFANEQYGTRYNPSKIDEVINDYAVKKKGLLKRLLLKAALMVVRYLLRNLKPHLPALPAL
jgi:hypothetical protein